MSVQLNPSSVLGFHRPLTVNVKRTLSISNNNALPVAFKVKTTAPKLYCVRPNSGRVEPGETVEVQVMLQAMKEEPPLNTKCKDKFLIQSTLMTPEKSGVDLWSIPETGDDATKIHSQRVKVAYLPPEGVLEEEEEQPQPQPQPRVSVLGDDERYGTVKSQPTRSVIPEPPIRLEREITPPAEYGAAREEPHEEPRIEEKGHAGVGVVNVNVHQPPAPSPPAPIPIAPSLSVPPPVDPNPELEAKLGDAQAEIQRLRALLAAVPDPSSVVSSDPSGTSPTELRRRYRPRSDDGATEVASDSGSTYISEAYAQPEGVPLQVVAIIALIVFITTYVFF